MLSLGEVETDLRKHSSVYLGTVVKTEFLALFLIIRHLRRAVVFEQGAEYKKPTLV